MTLAFLDTNLLVYAYSGDPRADVAYTLIRRPYAIGVQSLNEFANVAARKLHMPWNEITAASNRLAAQAHIVLSTELADHHLSLVLAERHQLSIFDSLLLAIALRANCDSF